MTTDQKDDMQWGACITVRNPVPARVDAGDNLTLNSH